MSLTEKEEQGLREGLADVANDDRQITEKLSAAVDASDAVAAAAAIAALGTTEDLSGVDGTGSNAASLTGTEARLDAIEAKIDELIAALAS